MQARQANGQTKARLKFGRRHVWQPAQGLRREALDVCILAGNSATHRARLGSVSWTLEVPRDSPTLSKVPRMIILQLTASMQWSLRNFDMKAAFLQGETWDRRRASSRIGKSFGSFSGENCVNSCHPCMPASGFVGAHGTSAALTCRLCRLWEQAVWCHLQLVPHSA